MTNRVVLICNLNLISRRFVGKFVRFGIHGFKSVAIHDLRFEHLAWHGKEKRGGYLSFLDVANVWMGRGGSKSVIHYDDQDMIPQFKSEPKSATSSLINIQGGC